MPKPQPENSLALSRRQTLHRLGRLGGAAGLAPLGSGVLGLAGLGRSSRAWAAAKPDWASAEAWQSLLNQLVNTKGLPVAWALESLENLQRQDKALALVNPPPDAPVIPRSLNRVLSRNLDAKTIAEGRAFMQTHRDSLNQASERYGVPGSIICGILGVETRFGRIQGSFPVRDTLASLALLSPRRSEFFSQELIELLLLAKSSAVDLRGLQGSFAGALGMPQFMPSSWRKYAVDFDQDGRIDLLKSPADAIGSVANFLLRHGWQRGRPTHRVVPPTVREALKVRQRVALEAFVVTRLTADHRLGDLRKSPLGAWIDQAEDWRNQSAEWSASLVHLPEPDRPEAHLWLAAPNFFAITQYNRSYVYAGSVLSLAAALENPGSPPPPRG
ncbi:MAG: lytic murein transglycosylase [Pseudomonadota bacterium]